MTYPARPKVLIVDDDHNLRRTLSNILQLKGYEPLTAGTGQDALEIAATQAPIVALIDLRLGDMQGLDVLKGLRELNAAIACVVLTGHASQSSAIEAINLGAYSYVQKPYDVDQLLLTIRRAIEKQEADTALRRSQALLHATGRMAKIGGWELDGDTRAYVWTDEMFHIHGVEADFEPTLASVTALYAADARTALESAIETALTSGNPFELELPLTTPQNHTLWAHIMGRAERDGDRIRKVSGTLQDITERKQSEETLRTTNRRLEEALAQLRETQQQVISQERLAAVGQLAAGLAHEYNNLMATIILYSDMILRTSALGTTDRERIAAIYEEGQRAADLTQQILDFSRKAILRKQDVDVGDFLRDLVRRLEQLLPTTIHISATENPPPIGLRVDPERLRQAMVNMALNARDAMPDGGQLRVEIRQITVNRETPGPVEGLAPGQWVILQMTDDGTGISPEVLPHIFEPFFTTRSPLGSGLGLSQVYGIVRQHDGYIDVRSEVGRGTTFEIYLPALPVPARRAAAEGDTADDQLAEFATQSAPLTLVIEEHDLVREALKVALESLNYQTLAMTTLKEASALRNVPDEAEITSQVRLVLHDVANRGPHGLPLVRELQTHFPEARIILIGDRIPDHDIQTLVGDGTVRWLGKPVDLVKLAEALADIAFDR